MAGNRYNMTANEFKSYTKLKPDGYISFSVVILDEGIKDVLVAFHRKEDVTSQDQLPYAVCRMNVYDMFSNPINQDPNVMYIGCSVSKDTCPQNVDYSLMVACNGIDKIDMVAIYYEDNLDSILHLVNTTAYDEVLYTLSKGYMKDKVRGVRENVRDLLENNRFMYDVYYGLNILEVQFKYIPELEADFTHVIEDIIKREMIAPVWVKFDRDIDIKAIKDSYLLIKDNENDLYIVSYKEGEYVNRPYFNSGDTTEYDVLRNIAQTNK
jgi:hypothetical protein